MTSTGSATIVIDRSPTEVWAAIADITRMGDYSPECTAGRWKGDATGPAVGAEFEGDNVAKLAGRTLKKWTTTSKVTACEPSAARRSATSGSRMVEVGACCMLLVVIAAGKFAVYP